VQTIGYRYQTLFDVYKNENCVHDSNTSGGFKSISIEEQCGQSALQMKTFAKVDYAFTYTSAVLVHLSIIVLLAQLSGRSTDYNQSYRLDVVNEQNQRFDHQKRWDSKQLHAT
jgi:hypothetical protein